LDPLGDDKNNSTEDQMKVSEILKVKGNILYTATPDMPLLEAINTMSERDIGSLVVMKEGKVKGMLSFREVMNAIDTQHRLARQGYGRPAHGDRHRDHRARYRHQ